MLLARGIAIWRDAKEEKAPGPIAVDLTGRQPEVVCRLCSSGRSWTFEEEEEGDDLADAHGVAEHPEVEEPSKLPDPPSPRSASCVLLREAPAQKYSCEGTGRWCAPLWFSPTAG